MFDKPSIGSQFEANLRTLDPACDGPPEPGERLSVTLGRRMKYPGNRGYVKYLVGLGYNPHIAGFLAANAVAIGQRRERGARMFSKVSAAFRFIATPARGKKAFLRNARILLAASEQTSLLRLLFPERPLLELDFWRTLRWTIDGDESARQRLTEIAGEVAHRVSVPPGRKITAASAAHEYILDYALTFLRRKYTRDPVESSYDDPLSQATQEEFGIRKFDPRPAYRRLLQKRI